MDTLIFQLQAPLSSWGDAAVGEYRPTADYPSQSAIHGLLGAALGIDRDDEEAQSALRTGFRIAVGVLDQGSLLRDYHTSQVPSRTDLKKRPHATRRDELLVPKEDLNTILSSRDYRQNAGSLVAVQPMAPAPYSLQELAAALATPRFVLYLGRKSCPPAAPLHPRVFGAGSIRAAFDAYQEQLSALIQHHAPVYSNAKVNAIQKIAWGDDFGNDDMANIGAPRDFSVNRKDQVISRKGWQFADRREHIALLVKE
jgi:CRISPR system Cascade subunit CasD